VLANTVLLQRLWTRWVPAGRWVVGGFLVASFLAFWYFYPILAGVGISYDAWYQRMWSSWLHFGFNWI
jgi:dolichyl-phosphate-mannose--protein O-mannosyl transferase